MNERIVMFPTLKAATECWIEICDKYKAIIAKKSKYPLSITLLNGDKWIFRAMTEGRGELLGYHGKYTMMLFLKFRLIIFFVKTANMQVL